MLSRVHRFKSLNREVQGRILGYMGASNGSAYSGHMARVSGGSTATKIVKTSKYAFSSVAAAAHHELGAVDGQGQGQGQ